MELKECPNCKTNFWELYAHPNGGQGLQCWECETPYPSPDRTAELEKEIERLKEIVLDSEQDIERYQLRIDNLEKKNEELADKIDELEDDIHKVINWCKAYPTDIFPEPKKEDWIIATKILKDSGYHLVNFSLGFTRYVLEGIEKILQEKG